MSDMFIKPEVRVINGIVFRSGAAGGITAEHIAAMNATIAKDNAEAALVPREQIMRNINARRRSAGMPELAPEEFDFT